MGMWNRFLGNEVPLFNKPIAASEKDFTDICRKHRLLGELVLEYQEIGIGKDTIEPDRRGREWLLKEIRKIIGKPEGVNEDKFINWLGKWADEADWQSE